jgi:integrase/recombinase XerD
MTDENYDKIESNPLDSITTLVPVVSPMSIPEVRLRELFTEAHRSWLMKSRSPDTRRNYARDVGQFIQFVGSPSDHVEKLAFVRPHDVAAWRDSLQQRGLTNSSIRRKLTALRSLFSYLQVYGHRGANPAHNDFVEAPPAPRDGKTVGLSPKDCRRLLDAPDPKTPVGVRDHALLAVLAYTGCRVGELSRLRIRDYKTTGAHRILEVQGKGGKERRAPLPVEAIERLDAWLLVLAASEGPLFRPTLTARGRGHDGFRPQPMSRRAVEYLMERYVRLLGFDSSVTVHSMRVTAITTARERGCDLVDLQDWAGHSDPRTTLAYIRNRDRLSRSPAYALNY